MKSVLTFILTFILGLGLGAVSATGQEAKTSVEAAREFVESHCIDCHNDRKQKGKTNLTPFLQEKAAFDRDLLLAVYDQLNLEEMPPEDEAQPSKDDRTRMLSFLDEAIHAIGASTIDKKSLPGYGNYVDHEALFEKELVAGQPAPSPQRIWRYSPESFSERVNRIAGGDVIKFVPAATFPVPQKGLKHPAFPYKGPAHTARDFSNIHDFGLTETELLIGLAEELAVAQLASGSLREYRLLPPGDAGWSGLLDEQFEKLYSRKPMDAEKQSLLDLNLSSATKAKTRQS